eukprot:Gb_09761 [translate_table: standard]
MVVGQYAVVGTPIWDSLWNKIIRDKVLKESLYVPVAPPEHASRTVCTCSHEVVFDCMPC